MSSVRADWAVALPLVGISALLYRETLAMPEGPATFPRAVSAVMGVLSLALLVHNFVRERGLSGTYWYSAGPGAMRTVVCVVALTAVYVYTLGKVSYLITTMIYFAVLMWFLGLRPRWLVPAISACGVVGLYVLFVRILHVALE